jgi:hypothetical protein
MKTTYTIIELLDTTLVFLLPQVAILTHEHKKQFKASILINY